MRTGQGMLESTQQESSRFGYSFLPGLLFVLLLWLVHMLSYFSNAELAWLGVFPRNFFGLVGVFLSPLIHSDLKHLLSNSFPLILLSGFILFIHKQEGAKVLILVYVLSGVFTWFIGRQSYHIGASGVVYGMAGFLLFHGFLTRDRGSLAVAFAVLFLYSGLFYGLFPKEERVSWEGHLAGMFAGLVATFFIGDHTFSKRRSNKAVVTVQPAVTQRHVSSTFIPYYMHYTIHYSLENTGKEAKPFVYTLTPDFQSDQKPPTVQYTSAIKGLSTTRKY
ncbi:rhomboid family intramembrane serine protease [Pontibacter sp. KCTC 32443]|uniref:rhomboid family intramembrane serine protease n=1 Tax=Pontibacter TaxID=323449 RepID=UPI00164D1B29|nr:MULTISPECIES: rhomboid family intramembrane serine protease [Pontibacter]MBC5772935.1 rhomboid family intramembrane serine protease [Pontibacter sp. KCTC 32443]